MKIWSKIFAGMLAVGMFAGCNNESANEPEITPPLPDGAKDAVYMSVDVTLPSPNGTRSETNPKPDGGSTGGTEVGQDGENKVSSLLLVLADVDNNYIGHSVVGNLSTSVVAGKSTVSATAAISATALKTYYDTHEDPDKKVNVFAFCNPTYELIDDLAKEDKSNWFDAKCKVVEEIDSKNHNTIIWSDGSFLMSNAKIAERRLPKTYDIWMTYYAKEDNPFDLCGKNDMSVDNVGPVEVERSVARFDYRDGSDAATGPNTYNVGLTDDVEDNSLQIKLVRMA